MKKYLLASLLALASLFSSGQIVSLIYHGDTLIAKNPTTGDSNIVMSGACAKFYISNYSNMLSLNAGSFNLSSATFPSTVSGITSLPNLVITESQATNLSTDLSAKAPLASPAFTGTPTGIGIPVYSRVTSSNFTTTGQSLVNITGLSAALTTNATYEFEAELSVSTSAVTTGTEYGVNYSVSGGTIEASLIGSASTTATKSERVSALNTASGVYLAGSGQSGQVLIKGIVTTGANAGNLTIETLKATSGTSTVFINSYLKVTRIN